MPDYADCASKLVTTGLGLIFSGLARIGELMVNGRVREAQLKVPDRGYKAATRGESRAKRVPGHELRCGARIWCEVIDG